MVRNAGGRAFDAIRTLAILQTIGAPGTIVVMHHTGESLSLFGLLILILQDCGMTHFHDADINKARLEIAPEEGASIEAEKYRAIKNS